MPHSRRFRDRFSMTPALTSPSYVIQRQPMHSSFVSAPARRLDCPPGLEYLCELNQLFVKQEIELFEVLTGCETKNRYEIKNSNGQNVFKAKEEVNCCIRNICGPIRPFEMTLKDNFDNEVIHLSRPLNCQSCFFPCCLQYIEIQAPPGTLVGSVEQNWTICYPEYTVRDENGDIVLRIDGPLCTYYCFGSVDFKIMTPNRTSQIGKISKQWSGLIEEFFTDVDYFGISFPKDLDVKCKATLLGALFLIDYMFFEKTGRRENDNIGML